MVREGLIARDSKEQVGGLIDRLVDFPPFRSFINE